MISAVQSYLKETALAFGSAWNEFWLRPSSPRRLAMLRIAVGLLTLLWFISFAADLTTLFGPEGLLPVEGVEQWEETTDDQGFYFFADGARRVTGPSPQMSVLALCNSATDLWMTWGIAVAATLLFTAGVFTRISSVGTLVMFLSFINRAPMLSGPYEAVAAMLLVYLTLAPGGAALSFDRWRRLRKLEEADQDELGLWDAPPHWSATVTLRLIQVHICAIYLLMALAQWGGGGGETPWATGQAAWLIGARPSAGLGFQWLASTPILIDFWTHGMWLFEFAFPLLIWVKRARPLLIVLATLVWLAFAALSGLFGFSLLMIVASFAFWPMTSRS